MTGKVKAEGGIYSLTYKDFCLQNGLYLRPGDKSVVKSEDDYVHVHKEHVLFMIAAAVSVK